MIYNVVFLSKAHDELLNAWEWYEDRQLGLGDKFKLQIFECLNIIEKHPERYPERRKYYREAIVKIFPYLIIYRIDKKKKTIAIVSIFHTRRNPKNKYKKK